MALISSTSGNGDLLACRLRQRRRVKANKVLMFSPCLAAHLFRSLLLSPFESR